MAYDQNGYFIPDEVGGDMGYWTPGSPAGGGQTVVSGTPEGGQTSDITTGPGGVGSSTQGVTTVATNNQPSVTTAQTTSPPATSATSQPAATSATSTPTTASTPSKADSRVVDPVRTSTIPTAADRSGEAPAEPAATSPVANPVAGLTPGQQAAAASILGRSGIALPGAGAAQQGGGKPMTLAELQPANEALHQGNPYYAAYTNSGDLAAAIPATLTDQQRVRLVDPQTGKVLVEGVGAKGAQQIATLATAVSNDLGRKAAWRIDMEDAPDSGNFISPGYDKADPHHNLLKTIVRIGAPLLAAAIPGLGPVLAGALGFGGSGAALAAGLGGALGTAATGGGLKESLLAGLTSGVGNSLGGGLSNVLKGSGSFVSGLQGTNPLGGLLKAGAGSLGGVTGSAAQAAADQAGMAASGINSILSGYTPELAGNLGASLADAAGSVAPAIVTGGGGSLTQSALQSILGSAGGVLGGGGGAADGSGTEPGTVDPAVVTAAQSGGYDPFALDFSALAAQGIDTAALQQALAAQSAQADPNDQPTQPKKSLVDELTSKDNLLDLAGQTTGDVAATMGIYGAANKLWGGDTGGDPNGIPNVPTNQPDDPADSQPQPGAQATPPPVANASTKAPAGGQGGFGGIGGALGQALGGVANLGSAGAGGGPLASAPDLNTQGSTAPDIYPWRKMITG